MEPTPKLPELNPEELRVLGVLIEKSKATPEYYPMTINGITAACNQKTSRKPVVNYDEHTVITTLDTLRKKGLVATATGGTSRTTKYKHNLAIVYPLLPPETAILCMLMLRGPQTPGELNTNSGRLYEFDSLEEVLQVLDKLAGSDTPFVKQLSRRPGQKETRYVHLFKELSDDVEDEFPDETANSSSGGLENRLAAVEQELAALKQTVDNLMKELMG